jgi:hypothetical protein
LYLQEAPPDVCIREFFDLNSHDITAKESNALQFNAPCVPIVCFQAICRPELDIDDALFDITHDFDFSKACSQDDCLNFISKPEMFKSPKCSERAIFNFHTGLALMIENMKDQRSSKHPFDLDVRPEW